MLPGSSRLDSWDELEYGDEVFYIADHLDAYWLDRPLTFKHDYANASQVRVRDFARGPHDLSIPDYPASDFVRMEALR